MVMNSDAKVVKATAHGGMPLVAALEVVRDYDMTRSWSRRWARPASGRGLSQHPLDFHYIPVGDGARRRCWRWAWRWRSPAAK